MFSSSPYSNHWPIKLTNTGRVELTKKRGIVGDDKSSWKINGNVLCSFFSSATCSIDLFSQPVAPILSIKARSRSGGEFQRQTPKLISRGVQRETIRGPASYIKFAKRANRTVRNIELLYHRATNDNIATRASIKDQLGHSVIEHRFAPLSFLCWCRDSR